MRKQFFFKSMLCLILGLVCNVAWAEVASLKISNETQKYYYVIKSLRTGKYAYYNGDNAQLLQQVNPTSATEQGTLNKYLWYVTEAPESAGDGAYMLHNVATTQVYAAYNSFTDAGAVVYIKENPYRSGYVCVSNNANATTTNSCWDDQGNQTKIGPYEPRQNDNEGTSWSFIEIDPNATVAYTLSDNAGNSYNGTFTGWSREMYPVVTGVAGYTLSNIVYGDKNVTATINFPFPVSKEGGATNWRFIETAKVSEKNTYISVRTSDNKIITRSTASNGMSYLPIADLDEIKKWMWAFYPEFDNGNFTFKIKNAATGMYVPSTPRPTSSSKVQNDISVTAKENSGSFSWGTCIGSGKGFYLSDDPNIVFGANSTTAGDQNAMLWYKNGTHAGCNLNIILPRYYVNYSLTDNSGLEYTETCSVEYTPNTTGELAEPTPTLTGIPSNMISGATFENNTYTATVNLPFSTSDLTNERPTMIESFAPSYTTALFYWFTPNGTNIKVAKNVSPSPLNVTSYMWAIYPQLESGVMKFTIKHIASGKYVYTTSTGNAHGDNTVTLNSTATKFILGSDGRLKKDGSTVFLSINTSSGDNGHEENLGTHSSEHEGTKLTYPEVSYNISVSEKNVASLTSPFAVTIPDGVVAKYVKAVDNQNIDDALTYTYLEGTIPANTPVIVSAPVGNQTFVMADETSAVADNILFSYNTETAVQGSGHESVYSMSIENDKVALRPFSGENYEAGETYLDITGKFAEQAPSSLNIYDYIAYKTEIEGYDNTTISGNSNTHLGTITLSSGACRIDNKLSSANVEASMESIKYWAGGFSLELTRKYRGYEFLGFWLGEEELGTTPTLTAEQANSVTEANPIIAKYKPTDEVTLFYDDDEFSYRIPAIAKTSTGRLIAVSDYRHNLDDLGRDKHGTGTHRIDLVMRYSDNDGETWSDIQTIAAGTGTSGANDCGYGDAAIATVGNKVLVMAAAGDVVFSSGSATAHNRTVRLLSEDNGETWPTKEDISGKLFIGESATIQNGFSAFFGSGKLAVDEDFNGTGNARIYGAMLIKNASGNYNNYVVYSDDLGANWGILGGSQTRVADGDEPKVEILPSGQILLSARRGGGRKFNVFTYGSGASDKASGVGTWSGAADGCGNGGSNATNGEIMCIDAKKPDGTAVILLLQSQPKGGGGQYDRKDVTIWYKEITNQPYTTTQIKDNWTEGLQVSTQQSSYSAMTLQADGKIAFFFEEAPCYGDDDTKGYSMVYVPLTIDEITKGRYLASNTDFEAEQSISVTLTDAEGNVYKDELTASLARIGTALTTKYPFIILGNNVGINLVDESYTYTNTVTLPFKVSNGSTTVWHNIYWPAYGDAASQRYPVYLSASSAEDTFVPKVTEGVQYGGSSYNTANNADKIIWAVYSVDNGFTFKFKNKLTGKFIQATSVADGDAQNVKYVDEASATPFALDHVKEGNNCYGDYALKATIGDNAGYLCSTSATGYHYATHYSGKGHAGAWVKFVEAPDFDALITEANEVLSWIGEGLGKYTVSESNTEIAETAKTAMQTPNTVKLNDLNTYKNLLDGATLNLPETGKFYYIQSANTNQYLSHIKSNTLTTTAQKSVNNIFYFESDGRNTYLVAYENGHYVTNPWNIGVGETKIPNTNEQYKQTKSFVEGQIGKYALKYFSDKGAEYYFTASGTSTNAQQDNSRNDAQWNLEPVTELPLTIHSSGKSTYSAPVDLEIPDDVTVYYAKRNDGETIRMAPLFDVIPANTGVVVQGEGTVSFPITTGAAALENNLLKPVVAAKAVTPSPGNSVFVMATKDGVTGFYPLSASNIISGHKSYLEIRATQAARLSIVWDDTETGIFETEGGVQNAEIYDLTGRRLDKPAKGVNVIGGKLVIK